MKTVVVTGSTRGIGRGLAENFLSRGCRVMISGRSQETVDAAVAELAAAFSADRVVGQACNIVDPQQIQSLWDGAMEAFGRVDIWINNAGVSSPRVLLRDADPADIKNVVDIDLNGMLQCNRVALKGMHEQGHGQIWNMEGFGSGGQTNAGMSVYGATKRAVNYLNKALQKEVADSPVQVCTLSPGIVVTDLLIGDYDLTSAEWQKARRVMNILGDTVETVTPFLVDGILKAEKGGSKVVWLTGRKAFARFMTARFKPRDLFSDIERARGV
ncbi:MAG: SDR family oxidoreductase [Pseudomonadota bacterium]